MRKPLQNQEFYVASGICQRINGSSSGKRLNVVRTASEMLHYRAVWMDFHFL